MLSLPGLPTAPLATHVLSGNRSNYDEDWMTIPGTKLYTNVFVIDEKEGKILLGYKKRGFGKGLFNGFGGKVEPGETIAQGAIRELEEEAGIRATIIHCGTLLFFAKGDSYAHLVEVFRATTPISGDPTESEEMRPAWYALSSSSLVPTPIPEPVNVNVDNSNSEAAAATQQITITIPNPNANANADLLPSVPFDQMWADVALWFPLLVTNKRFIGRVDFAAFTDEPKDAQMLKWWIGTICD